MVSGIPGGSILPIYDALSQSTQIRHIWRAMSRARALSPRDGAYRRQAGGLYGLQRPGGDEPVTAIADARPDSIPLVCITGRYRPR